MPTDVSQVPSKATVTSPLPPTQSHTPPSTTSPSTQESAPSRSRRGGDDDIYEFREPEPFEFEVRGKRESPFNEDRVHHHRILSPQQKKPGKEDEEDNPKATTVTFSGFSVSIKCICYYINVNYTIHSREVARWSEPKQG